MLSRIHRMQVITHRHRTPAAAIQSAKREPREDHKVTLTVPHVIHNENRLFLSCRSWWSLVSQYVDADCIFLEQCVEGCGQCAGAACRKTAPDCVFFYRPVHGLYGPLCATFFLNTSLWGKEPHEAPQLVSFYPPASIL